MLESFSLEVFEMLVTLDGMSVSAPLCSSAFFRCLFSFARTRSALNKGSSTSTRSGKVGLLSGIWSQH